MAAACRLDFDIAKLRERVRSVYTLVASDPAADGGAGMDLLRAVRRTGPTGTAIGVDATPVRCGARLPAHRPQSGSSGLWG